MKNHAPSNPRIKPVNGLEMANHSGIASRNGSESRLRRRQGVCFIAFTLIIFVVDQLGDLSIFFRRRKSEQLSKARFVKFACPTIAVGLNPFWMLDPQSVVDLPLKLSVRADATARRKSVRFH